MNIGTPLTAYFASLFPSSFLFSETALKDAMTDASNIAQLRHAERGILRPSTSEEQANQDVQNSHHEALTEDNEDLTRMDIDSSAMAVANTSSLFSSIIERIERLEAAMNDHLEVVRSFPNSALDAPGLPIRADNLVRSSTATPSAHGSRHYARTQRNAPHPYARQKPIGKPNGRRVSPPGFDVNVYHCLWREHFGGNCEYSFASDRLQAHDRHILTHLPDDKGYSRANFMCMAHPTGCRKVFNRLDAVTRHIRYDHSAEDTNMKDTEVSKLLGVPWWWPTPLFRTAHYRTMVATSNRPHGVTHDWKTRILEIIAKYPLVLNKPFKRPRQTGQYKTRKCDNSYLSHIDENDSGDANGS